MKNRTTHGLGALAILGILILSNTASACGNPTDSFATEVLLNKPGVSYNLSGMIESDDVIVKTKEVPVESEPVGGVPTPQAIMIPPQTIVIPNNNSTAITETVSPKLPAETRTELDRIIYRSHYNQDVAVILSDRVHSYNEGGWDDGMYISVRIQIPTKDVHKSVPYVRIRLIEDVNAAVLDIDTSAGLGWDFEVSGGGSRTTEGGGHHSMKSYSLRKSDIQIDAMPAGRASLEKTDVCVTVNNATSLSESAKDEITDVLVAIGFFEPTDIIDDTAIASNIREWDDLESAIAVAADDFDFGYAMKTELGYLIDNDVVVGLTDGDVDEIASASVRGAAGYNSRIFYEDGEWIPYHETGRPILIKTADCGGFSITELPGETASSVPTESTTHAPAPDRTPTPTVPAFTAFTAVAGLLAVAYVRRRGDRGER
ncbi:MAG: hypothetical protein U9N36_06875 [Euryarchaeota archaeon]|nr:hypothetical protein [Euryarchaeota archaeon]